VIYDFLIPLTAEPVQADCQKGKISLLNWTFKMTVKVTTSFKRGGDRNFFTVTIENYVSAMCNQKIFSIAGRRSGKKIFGVRTASSVKDSKMGQERGKEKRGGEERKRCNGDRCVWDGKRRWKEEQGKYGDLYDSPESLSAAKFLSVSI